MHELLNSDVPEDKDSNFALNVWTSLNFLYNFSDAKHLFLLPEVPKYDIKIKRPGSQDYSQRFDDVWGISVKDYRELLETERDITDKIRMLESTCNGKEEDLDRLIDFRIELIYFYMDTSIDMKKINPQFIVLMENISKRTSLSNTYSSHDLKLIGRIGFEIKMVAEDPTPYLLCSSTYLDAYLNSSLVVDLDMMRLQVDNFIDMYFLKKEPSYLYDALQLSKKNAEVIDHYQNHLDMGYLYCLLSEAVHDTQSKLHLLHKAVKEYRLADKKGYDTKKIVRGLKRTVNDYRSGISGYPVPESLKNKYVQPHIPQKLYNRRINSKK